MIYQIENAQSLRLVFNRRRRREVSVIRPSFRHPVNLKPFVFTFEARQDAVGEVVLKLRRLDGGVGEGAFHEVMVASGDGETELFADTLDGEDFDGVDFAGVDFELTV